MTSSIISITDAAKAHFESSISQREDGWGIYIGIRPAGCSGSAYVVEFWDGKQCNDNSFRPERPHHINGVPIVINPAHEIYLTGMEIDFVKDGLNTGIRFNNPNVTSQCGCGESQQFG